MASVNFIYEGIETSIQCMKGDKMRNICYKYTSKIKKDITSLYFLYNGNQINYELTFYEQANSTDKQRLEMNILVYNINDDSNELKCPKCGCNIYNNKIINNIIKYNNNINNLLLEIKKQIEDINDINQIANKKRVINFIINDIINENNKIKAEIQYNLNNDLKEFDCKMENNDNIYNNFDIKLKNPIHILNDHKETISCAIVLKDGRFATCSKDKSIIIYNNKTYKPDLIIKEHNDYVRYLLQLSNGMLASCSDDKTIKIFNIKYNNYDIFQTLNNHADCVNKIIEINNNNLFSCSDDSSIIGYSKDNDKYKKEYQIKTNGPCYCIIQTKDSEISYYDNYDNYKGSICFYDLIKNQITNTISNVNKGGGINFFNMITKNLLLITGKGKITLINVNQYSIVRIIDVSGSPFINCSSMLNQNIILTGDYKRILQWRIEDNNLKLISTKENAHDDSIYTLIKLDNGHILSGSVDGEIKIW